MEVTMASDPRLMATVRPLQMATSAPAGRDEAVLLAKRAAAGDAVATRQLLENIAPRVIRATRAVLGAGHPEAEDAVQLALIGFIQSLPGFRGECNPSLYAARIAVRTASALRRRSKARHADRDELVDVDAVAGERVDSAAARRREVVRALLDDLPEEQSEALALRFMLGWSLLEISETSGAPVNTVRSRLRLAKEALRKRVQAEPALAEDFGLDREES
jgi:RNA polymerase sigma-70 factor (ECF subfamily)